MRGSLSMVLMLGLAAGCAGNPEPKTPSAAELITMLQSGDVAVQREAAHWVIKEGQRAASTTPALIAALKSADTSVRQSAALALGHVGPDAAQAVPALTAALDDTENSVRQTVAETLGKIGPAAAAAIPALEKLSQEGDKCNAAPAALKKIRP